MHNQVPSYLAALVCGTALASQAFAMPVEKGATVEAVAPSQTVDFEVFLPLRDEAGLDSLIRAQSTPGAAQYHRWLTPAQFAARFGPTPASMAKVQAAARAAGLEVTSVHSRSFHVMGTADQAARLLGTHLNSVKSPSGGARLLAAGAIAPPAAMTSEGAMVVSFVNLPKHQVSSVKSALVKSVQADPDNRQSPGGGYWFTDLKQAYDYPAYWPKPNSTVSPDGTGVNVAVLMADLVLPWRCARGLQTRAVDRDDWQAGPRRDDRSGQWGRRLQWLRLSRGQPGCSAGFGGAPGSNVSLISIPDLSDLSILAGYLYIDEFKRL